MNYIQRLLDGSAPMQAGSVGPTLSAPILSPVASARPGLGSPVLAADQRLGLFPDLVGPAPGLTGAETTQAGVARQTVGPPPRSGLGGGTDGGATPYHLPETPHQVVDKAPSRPISRLQEWAESAPLPLSAPPQSVKAQPPPPQPAQPPPWMGHPQPQAQPEMLPQQPATPTRPKTASHPIAPPSSAPSFIAQSPNPASSPTPSLTEASTAAAPWPITAAQFQPLGTPSPTANSPTQARPLLQESVPPLPQPDPPAVRVLPNPLPLEPQNPPSPLAYTFQQAMPPPSAVPPSQPVEAAPPEPIVTRRSHELSARPATRPKAATAAAQSVIGPLGTHRFGRWSPRQEGV